MKKVISSLIISSLILPTLVFADNKTDLQTNITTIENKINTYNSNLKSDLNNKITNISNDLNKFLSSYDGKSIDYLVSLWKMNSNFSKDLVNELNLLTTEMNSNFTTNSNDLTKIKNSVNLSQNISDTEKNRLLSDIEKINSSIENNSWTINQKINTLTNKYSSSLSSYKDTFKNSYSQNESTINSIKNFDSNFQEVFKINSDFEKNYETFKNTYLSFAWELKNFSQEKQDYYVKELTQELNTIRDKNIANNPPLANYTTDINRLIEILIENFKNSLKNHVDENYQNVFWTADIDSIKLKFDTIKNKYYDSDWILKTSSFISNSWALDEVIYLKTSLKDLNNQINTLIWTWWTESLTFSNLKIRLENHIIRYWNTNYDTYRQDLLLKLKEKINIINQETKTTVAFSDNIDIRYNILSDKINKSTDLNMIKEEITKFKSDTKKYNNLQSEVITKKLNTLNRNLDIYSLKVELKQWKYKFLNWSKYKTALDDFFTKFEQKFKNTYKEKLEKFISNIDTMLEKNISDKKRFMLLNVKLETLNFLSTK